MNPSLFIHYSSISSFNHHHQTKNHHKQTCNRATLRSFSVKKLLFELKTSNPAEKDEFRGKKDEFRGYSAAQIPREFREKTAGKPKFRGIPRPLKTVGPNHHHQERTPLWGMAVRMSPLQTVRSCARCQAEKRPMVAGFRSASTVWVHVCAGLPLRLFQSRGWPCSAYRARRWSNSGLARVHDSKS